ncbi:hypothetical protein [Promicromonospora sp. NPDC050262]|uniref:hypothetical protein n=1 Tax=Promicromonospora sp. NPDC050262 TaxID=3155036 RepID=UPI0033EE349A
MAVETHVVTATIDPGGLNLVAPISGGTLTTDASWVPYHQGQVTVPMGIGDIGAATLDVLPVRIDASVVGNPDATEQWNLHARQVRKDYLADTYTIDVASAEALVQDWGANTSSTAFAADRDLSLICRDILRMVLGNPTLNVGVDTAGLQIDNTMRVWTAGTPAWDYLAEICNSMSGRTLSPTAFGSWQIRPAEAFDVAPVNIPNPEDALSYVEEWSRNGDFADAVTVQFTGGDPSYTTIAVPGSSPAVSVQVEVKRFGTAYFPTTATAKPALSKALDTTTTVSRDHPADRRDLYASFVEHRRRNLGYFLTWRTLSHYGVHPRSAIGDTEMFIDRVTHDFGTNEMNVSARLPYNGDPV